MTAHRLPTWYSWVVVVLVPVMASVGVLVVSLRVNQRSIERERAARQATEQAFCQIIIVLDDAYARAAPPTAAGKQLAAAIAGARQANHCAPRAR